MILKLSPQIKSLLNTSQESMDHSILCKLLTAENMHLLQTCSLVLKSPPPRQKSEKLVKILESVQNAASNTLYEQSRDSVLGTRQQPIITPDLKHVSKALYGIVNILLSVSAVVAAVFYTSSGYSLALKVGAGLVFALMILIAEGWFFIRDIQKMDV